MTRRVIAVLLGVVVGVVTILATETAGAYLFPLPGSPDLHDREAMRAAMAQISPWALLLVAVGWFVGTALGAGVASRVARRGQGSEPPDRPAPGGGNSRAAVIVGALFLASGVVNLLTLPHPAWFWVVGLLTFPAGAWVGAWMGWPSSLTGAPAVRVS